MLYGIGFIGWIHTIACTFALICGAIVLWQFKGGAVHKRLGVNYVIASLVANVSALCIYRMGGFNIFHVLAIATLASLVIAFVAARWKTPTRFWLRIHLTAIIFSYYQLVGGLINETFVRLPGLKSQVTALNLCQGLGFVFFLMVIAYFWGKTSRQPIAASQVATSTGIAYPVN